MRSDAARQQAVRDGGRAAEELDRQGHWASRVARIGRAQLRRVLLQRECIHARPQADGVQLAGWHSRARPGDDDDPAACAEPGCACSRGTRSSHGCSGGRAGRAGRARRPRRIRRRSARHCCWAQDQQRLLHAHGPGDAQQCSVQGRHQHRRGDQADRPAAAGEHLQRECG